MSEITTGADNVATPTAIVRPTPGLRYELYPRTHRGMLTENMAMGYKELRGRVTGRPAVSATHTSFPKDCYVDAPLAEPTNFMILIALRLTGAGTSNDTKSVILYSVGASTADPTRTVGLNFRQDSAANILCTCSQWAGSAVVPRSRFAPYTPGQWMILEVGCGDTYFGAFNRTQGGGSALNNFTLPRDVSSAPVRIGTNAVGSQYRGNVDIAGVNLIPTFLADEQRALEVASFKATLAAAGLPGL